MSKIKIDLGNGGFHFTVKKMENAKGVIPVLNINAEMFGHKMGEMEMRITPDRLKQIGEFLIEESVKADEYYNNEETVWGGAANSKFFVEK